MHLDPFTLMITGVVTTAFAAVLLAGAWWHNRSASPLLWWSAANALSAIGVATMGVGFARYSPSAIMAGVGITALAPGLYWGGTRRFNDQDAPVAIVVGGFILWISAAIFPFGIDNLRLSAMANFVSWFVYLVTAAWALRGNMSEELIARWPLVGAFSLHALVFAAAFYDVARDASPLQGTPPIGAWFSILHFESVLYSMGTAMFMVLICKERIEIGYIKAAKIDSLTGTVNRGAFFETAQRMLDRCRRDNAPLSLIMFDLDRFKTVNDTHGHQAGDHILSDFAETVRQSLRPSDLFGRYGGEEFAVVLPGASIETARAIAERVRRLFSEQNEFLNGVPLRATVSAGVASAAHGRSLHGVLAAADQALYSAKRGGRNRVECAPLHPVADEAGVVRIA